MDLLGRMKLAFSGTHPDTATAFVFAALLWHAGDDGKCFPSMVAISAETGLSLSSVRRAIRKLERLGAIKTLPSNGRYTNSYQINFDFKPGHDERVHSERVQGDRPTRSQGPVNPVTVTAVTVKEHTIEHKNSSSSSTVNAFRETGLTQDEQDFLNNQIPPAQKVEWFRNTTYYGTMVPQPGLVLNSDYYTQKTADYPTYQRVEFDKPMPKYVPPDQIRHGANNQSHGR